MDFKIPDTPDTDSIWDRMGNEWQRKVVTRACPPGMRCKGMLGMSQFGWCESVGVRDINFWIVGVLFYTQNFKGKWK